MAGWSVGFVLVFIISIPLNGLLISATWGWFVAPITGARGITIAEGVGLSMFCATIGTIATAHLKEWKFGDDNSGLGVAATVMSAMVSVGVIGPLCGLAFAWVWHTFAM